MDLIYNSSFAKLVILNESYVENTVVFRDQM